MFFHIIVVYITQKYMQKGMICPLWNAGEVTKLECYNIYFTI